MRGGSCRRAGLALIALVACGGGAGGGGRTGCTDECPSSGATQCSGTGIRTCQAGADGCLAWSAPTGCPAAQACSAATQSCVASCTDGCPSSGATRCSGAEVQTCTASNGCLAWSAPSACAAGLTCDAGLNGCARGVTLSWAANRESGVNAAGGGYELQISGQPALLVPFVSGATAPTSATVRMAPGRHTVAVRAFASLDPQGGSTRTFSAASKSIDVDVP